MSIEKPKFVFAIPLRAKASSRNWDKVCKNLQRTMSNLSRQSDPGFKVYIAAHERPSIDYYNLDVEIVLAPFPPPSSIKAAGSDKFRKNQLIGAALRSQSYAPLYVMPLDADDLVDPSLVEFVRTDDNKKGYLITNKI